MGGTEVPFDFTALLSMERAATQPRLSGQQAHLAAMPSRHASKLSGFRSRFQGPAESGINIEHRGAHLSESLAGVGRDGFGSAREARGAGRGDPRSYVQPLALVPAGTGRAS